MSASATVSVAAAAVVVTVRIETVSQALRRVKVLKGKLGEFSKRMVAGVSFEETKPPPFNYASSRETRTSTVEELLQLQTAIARANAKTTIVFDGRTLFVAEAVRRLEELKLEIKLVSDLTLRSGTERVPDGDYDYEGVRPVRRMRDVVWKSELTEVQRAAELERLNDCFARLNDAVETSNHITRIELPSGG